MQKKEKEQKKGVLYANDHVKAQQNQERKEQTKSANVVMENADNSPKAPQRQKNG